MDSTIVVSAFLTSGLTAELIRLCGERVALYTARVILREMRTTLLEREHIRRRYKYPDSEAEGFINRFEEASVVFEELPVLQGITRDPDDDMIIACAVAASADYIVSRDRDLLDLGEYQGIQIVSPEAFMPILREL